jgi:hypothetical protein
METNQPRMPKNRRRTILYILVFAAVALAIGGYYYWSYYKYKARQTAVPTSLEMLDVPYDEIDPEVVPLRIPQNIPLEKDAAVIANYVDNKSEVFQSTRKFVSKKSLEENYQIYSQYLKDWEWSIISQVDEKDLKYWSATNEKYLGVLGITISRNANSGEVVVDITHTLRWTETFTPATQGGTSTAPAPAAVIDGVKLYPAPAGNK